MINPNTFVKENMPESLFCYLLQAVVQRCFGDPRQNCSFLPSVPAGQQQVVQWGHAQAAGWFQKVSKALMPVLCCTHASPKTRGCFASAECAVAVHTYHWSAPTPDNSKNRTRLYFAFLRPEKMAKLPVILGNLDVTIDNVAPDLTSETRSLPERWEPSVFLQGCLFNLPPAPVHRLCYLILHSCEAVWRRREGQHLLWSGGVCAVHSQMLSAFHHLQQSPLCLPKTLEVWQPKVIRKGIRQGIPLTSSSSSAGTLVNFPMVVFVLRLET